ncbi:MAG: hypothetical protein AB7O38_28935, partial [Pirellulaceae bacterium]
MSTTEKNSDHRAGKKGKPARGKSEGRLGEKGDKSEGVAALMDQNPHLKTTLQQIEKQFGEGSIMPLGADAQLAI